MERKTLAACVMVFALAGCQTSYTYEPIIPNPENLEMANARCNLMASSAEQGIVAWGTPEYVAGAQLGNAIGNAVRVDNFMKQCMTLQGWRRVDNATKAAATKSQLTAEQRNTAISMLAISTVANRCNVKLSAEANRAVAAARSVATADMRREAAASAKEKMRPFETMGKKAYCEKARAIFAESQLL